MIATRNAPSTSPGRGYGRLAYPVCLAMLGAMLVAGGAWLEALGGSPYFLLAGIALMAAAWLIARRRREGKWLYAAIIVTTLAWAVWDSGFKGWSLVPRVVPWFVVGAWMITPWFNRTLLPAPATNGPAARLASWGGFVFGLVAAAGLGGALHALDPDPADPLYQAGVDTTYPAAQYAARDGGETQWVHYGNDQGGSRFSTLDQIDAHNVSGLKPAWRASLVTSELSTEQGVEATPIMIGGTLYVCNGVSDVFAIDAETGRERWRAAPSASRGHTCRGVAYFRGNGPSGPCQERIIAATGDAGLVAFDAKTGGACRDFGKDGRVDLLEGMSTAPAHYYYVTSAPAIVRGKVVVGGMVLDGQFWGEPSGVVRGFDAVTGKLAWAWDMGAPDRSGMPPPGQSYTPSTPNSWGPISADEQLGLVYLPTGNSTPDFFGGNRRPFDEKYASSVVALDVDTGRPRWHFQTIHHDLWDYDVAAQPTLVDMRLANGTVQHALVQATKSGELFVLDRATGKPLRRVQERPVAQNGGVPEERLAPTQPFSIDMPSFRGPVLRERDMWGLTPLDQLYCRIRFRQSRYDGIMTPPGVKPWISLPGFIGGVDWGGISVDVDHGVAIVNSSVIANRSQLYTRQEADKAHIRPATSKEANGDLWGPAAQVGTPYAVSTDAFKSPLGMPCQAPPFGRLSAVDLRTGRLIWTQPLGMAGKSVFHVPVLFPFTMGTPTTGGSLTTRGGLTFIAATQDRTFRAYATKSGDELWSSRLARGGFASPMTYLSPASGRQFVVIAAGGSHGIGETGGAELIAFAVPK